MDLRINIHLVVCYPFLPFNINSYKATINLDIILHRESDLRQIPKTIPAFSDIKLHFSQT